MVKGERLDGKWFGVGGKEISQGYLEMGDQGIEACLNGIDDQEDDIFIEGSPFESEKHVRISSLVFQADNSEIFSCFRLDLKRSNGGFGQNQKEIKFYYKCQAVLRGMPGCSSEKEKCVKRLYSGVENLFLWANLNPLKISNESNSIKLTAKNVKTKYYKYGNRRIRFLVFNNHDDSGCSVTVRAVGQIEISNVRLKGLFDTCAVFEEIKLLISILYGKDLSLYGQSVDIDFDKKIGNEKKYCRLEVFTKNNNNENIDRYPSDALIDLSSIEDFQNILDVWQKRSDNLGRAVAVARLAVFDKSMPLDARFISIVSSLESLGGEDEIGKYIGKSEYKDLKNDLKGFYMDLDIPEELKDSISQKISEANEKILRLKIADTVEKSFSMISHETDCSVDELAKLITKTRNLIAHGGVVNQNHKLFRNLTLYAGYLLIYRILTLLKVEPDVAIERIKEKSIDEHFSIKKEDIQEFTKR